MNKPSIADVLHRAADEFLVSTQSEYNLKARKQMYSCSAVNEAVFRYNHEGAISHYEAIDIISRIKKGLRNMGVNPDSTCQFTARTMQEVDPKVQERRYVWLKFAAMIAEEQGV